MSHESENPLIIDVVGEVEPPESNERRASKKSGRSTGKKRFFRREKAASDTTATQAASEAEVDAAKRAAVAASVPPVQGPAHQAAAAQGASSQSASAVEQEAPASVPQADASAAPQPQPQEAVQPVQEAQPQVQQVAQPVQQAQQPVSAVQPHQPVQAEAPQPYVPAQSVPVQPTVEPQPQQPAPVQQPAQPQAQQPVQPVQPQVQPPVQPAQPQAQRPVQPSAVPVAVAPQALQGNMAASVPTRSRAFYVFGILAVAVLLFAAAAFGFFSFLQNEDNLTLVPTSTVSEEADEVKPIVSASLDQASKVSLRATAEGWNEQESTPAIAYIKRVEEASGDEPVERYFAFAPDQSASVSLPAGRYAFSFIPPMNSDGSLYAMPEMVDMVVGDGGMAVLPVAFERVSKEDATPEQVIRTLAQLKTAYEKGDASLHTEAFSRTIDLALSTWFPQEDAELGQPATELTNEQQEALNAQADSQQGSQSSGGTGSSSNDHEHAWVAQHESRWQPSVVPVIDSAAWESPVYARYRCQEGILFETLEECQRHVRERGNEPYSASNEIIRIDYHPAVVHYEQQGSYTDVVTGYRCSICGVRGTLQ